MKFWLDAQLPPSLAKWLTDTFGVETAALRELGLRDASDLEIFNAARQAKAVVITKDSDFAELVYRLGAPPQIVWVTCGNASNAHITGFRNHIPRHDQVAGSWRNFSGNCGKNCVGEMR